MMAGWAVCRRAARFARRVAAPAAALAAALSMPACDAAEAPPAIQINGARLTVQNRTDRAWAAVEIWVNGQYRVEVPSIAPGQAAQVDLRTFVAGFGQRFDPERQVVRGVEVSAREGSRRETKQTWGTVWRR
jgi:hypothetical protein